MLIGHPPKGSGSCRAAAVSPQAFMAMPPMPARIPRGTPISPIKKPSKYIAGPLLPSCRAQAGKQPELAGALGYGYGKGVVDQRDRRKHDDNDERHHESLNKDIYVVLAYHSAIPQQLIVVRYVIRRDARLRCESGYGVVYIAAEPRYGQVDIHRVAGRQRVFIEISQYRVARGIAAFDARRVHGPHKRYI